MKLKFLLAATAIAITATMVGCKADETAADSSGGDSTYSSQQTEDSGSLQDNTGDTIENTADGTESSQENTDISEVTVMYITINSNKLGVELAQNSSVTALVEILRQNDVTYTADDYGNFEKVGDIGYTLPRNDEEITTQAGDVILYLGNNICLYYGTNTWSFTRIGKIKGYTEQQLKDLLGAGSGSVQITLSLK